MKKQTMLHIKIDRDLKIRVQKIADELGLSISAIVVGLLKKFVQEKRIVFDLNEEK